MRALELADQPRCRGAARRGGGVGSAARKLPDEIRASSSAATWVGHNQSRSVGIRAPVDGRTDAGYVKRDTVCPPSHCRELAVERPAHCGLLQTAEREVAHVNDHPGEKARPIEPLVLEGLAPEWQRARIGPDDMRVWLVDCDGLASLHPQLVRLLSDDERERALNYRRVRDARRYEIRRALLRVIAATEVGGSPSALAITAGGHGKPVVVGAEVGVARAGRWALLGIAPRATFGLDLEVSRTLPARVVTHIRSRCVGLRDHPSDFMGQWTLYEARIKALGTCLVHPQLIELDRVCDLNRVRLPTTLVVERGVTALLFAVPPSLRAAVVVRAEGITLRVDRLLPMTVQALLDTRIDGFRCAVQDHLGDRA